MLRKVSWLGLLLAGVYIALTAYFIYLGLTCTSLFCEVAPVLPILIWTPLIELFLKDIFAAGATASFAIYTLLFLVDIVVLYAVGHYTGRYFQHHLHETTEERY